MSTRIKIFRYLVTGCHKNCQLVAVVPKAHGRANVCVHRKSIKPCNLKKMFWGLFYRGWFVVGHPCSNFSLRRQMAPLQRIKFQTANFFSIFCARIVVIFWTTCIAREVSLVVMYNGKQDLPILQCLKRGIAFVSSCFCFELLLCFL